MSAKGRCLASEASELKQHRSQPGWVEHDAAEIWRKTLRVIVARVGAGALASLDEAAAMHGEVECFASRLGEDRHQTRLAGWKAAVDRMIGA